MNDVKIKFCGIKNPEDIEAVNRIRPEYIGFVFWEKSRRYVTSEAAAELKAKLDPAIQAVGVFVDEDPGVVEKLLGEGLIDLAQLHGQETDEMIRQLQERTGKQIVRAFQIRTAADMEEALKSSAGYLLLDSGTGSGRTFDWSLLRRPLKPFFLAGGLKPENVAEAIRQFRPFAVDVSSGIETDGKKDHEKMSAFAGAVRKERYL